MNDIEERQELTIFELAEKIQNLKGFLKKYYEMLPDRCWMAEQTQAEKLKVGRTKVKNAKKKLIDEGLLELEILPNGKRLNNKHILNKTYPIKLCKREDESNRYSVNDVDFYENFYYSSEINWSLLQEYTAQELNSMEKLEKIQIYIDCGFIVIPAYYPIFDETGKVRCSCDKAYLCQNIGKHPIYRYKHINCFNYELKKQKYLKVFKENPELNIAFKVLGYSVLDIDFRHNGDKTLERLLNEDGLEMKHVISVRGGNGLHYYADNKNLKNTAGVIGDGLDVRSECGVVIAPGSKHKSGKVYEWNEIGDVATIPNHWVENSDYGQVEVSLGDEPRNNKSVSKNLKDIVLPKKLSSDYVIRDGGRELTLFKWGCRFRGQGKNAEKIFDELIAIRDTFCEDGSEPITDGEIKDIADSAAKYPTNARKRLSLE